MRLSEAMIIQFNPGSSVIDRELKCIATVAAERHPRNYYAWDYMRWLISRVRDLSAAQISGALYAPLDTRALTAHFRDWCLKHPSDTSGWSFLLWLMTIQKPSVEATSTCTSTFTIVLDLTMSFRWRNESVWVFLRTLAASELVAQQHRSQFLTALDSVLQDNSILDDTRGRSVVQDAKEWYTANECKVLDMT